MKVCAATTSTAGPSLTGATVVSALSLAVKLPSETVTSAVRLVIGTLALIAAAPAAVSTMVPGSVPMARYGLAVNA